MRKIYLLLIIFLLFAVIANAQNVNVNPGAGSYPTVKAAFDAINAGTHIGSITINITGSTTETASAILNASGTGASSYTSISISPSGGVPRTISGNIAGYFIDLNGADNVTIDGLNTGGNSLTISNTATGTVSTIRFIADASNNTITNCTIQGSVTDGTSGVVKFSTGTVTGNDNNDINHCSITAAGTNLPIKGIYSEGTSATIDNSNNTLNTNNISDYFNATASTVGIHLSFNNSSWLITNNKLFQTATRLYTTGAAHYGIYLSGSSYNVTGNIIGFANSSGTGTTNMVGNSVPLLGSFPDAYNITGTSVSIIYTGIYCVPTDFNSVSEIQGNTIAGFAMFTGSGNNNKNGVWCGIFNQFGYANIGTTAGNIIGATSGTGSVYVACTTSGALTVGIYSTSNRPITIQNNNVGAIDAMGTTSSVCGSIMGINAGNIGDPAGYKSGNSFIYANTIGNATNPNIRMGNLTTGSFLSNIGTTFSASSGLANFNGIADFQTSTVVIGSAALPNIVMNVYMNSTSSSTSSYARGIYNYTGSTVTISSNIVTEINSNSTNTNSGDPVVITGISNFSTTTGQIIELNSISGLRAINTTANNIYVKGIYFSSSSGTGNVQRNKVYDLTIASSGTSPQIFGIEGGGSFTIPGWTYSNNMISLTNGPNTNPVSILGIYDRGFSTILISNYYFNSVNIGGSSSGGSLGSFAFYRDGITTNTHRNNIYTNTRTGGTATHYSIFLNSATPASGWSASASDYNVLNSLGTIIGYWGTIDVDFAGWKSNSLGDNNSLSGIPLNFVNAETGDLHLLAGSNCGLDGYGTPVVSYTTDYDGETRNVTTPDIGADEFNVNYSGTLAGTAGSATCENKTVSVIGTTYATNACNLIASILPSGADPVTGKINTCVTLDASQQYFNAEPYVQRHYDIEPVSSNITTTSATITLYFTDAEFVLYNFNNPVWPKLPTVAGGANTDPNRANVKITQYHGTPTTTPSSPGNYTGNAGSGVLILPTLSNVFWNGTHWAVSFNVTGFSGFYLHTKFPDSPLPITVNYFSGTKQGSNNLLNWKVTCYNTPKVFMTLERSVDNHNYSSINTITIDAVHCNQDFDYTDAQPLIGINYYRLKMTNSDGKVTYSNIVALLKAVKGFEIISISPNPVTNSNYKLNVTSAQASTLYISITDMQGRVVNRKTISVIAGFNSLPMTTDNLATGIYTLQGSIINEKTKLIRFVKK